MMIDTIEVDTIEADTLKLTPIVDTIEGSQWKNLTLKRQNVEAINYDVKWGGIIKQRKNSQSLET